MSKNHSLAPPGPASSESSPDATPLRRKPVQQRSAKRLERMLNATAELLDEVGYEELTTTLIAKRADVAVGSLYQFFPDKRAVVQALRQRNMKLFASAANERLGTLGSRHWWHVVDSLLDTYLRMHREVPGFSAVRFGEVVDPLLLDEGRADDAMLADTPTELLTHHVAEAGARMNLPVSVVTEAADALLKLAFRHDPAGDPDVVAEAKYLIKGYLVGKFGE